MSNRENLSGVFAPVNTPFTKEKLRLDFLKNNLEFYSKSKLKGYLALGSNGEFRSLTEKEQWQVLEVFAEHKGDKNKRDHQQVESEGSMSGHPPFQYPSSTEVTRYPWELGTR